MVERVEAQWWSVPQAIVWIVTRDVTQVADAADVRFLPEIWRLPLPRFFSIGDQPPIAAHRASDVFLSAIWQRTVEVFGCRCGEGNPERVFLGDMIGPILKDDAGGIRIVEDFGNRWPLQYWSDLATHPNECMRRWPDGRAAPPTRGNKPAEDDKVIAAVGPGKSFRAAAADFVDEIPGHGTAENRKKRVAAKARKVWKSMRK